MAPLLYLAAAALTARPLAWPDRLEWSDRPKEPFPLMTTVNIHSLRCERNGKCELTTIVLDGCMKGSFNVGVEANSTTAGNLHVSRTGEVLRVDVDRARSHTVHTLRVKSYSDQDGTRYVILDAKAVTVRDFRGHFITEELEPIRESVGLAAFKEGKEWSQREDVELPCSMVKVPVVKR